MNIIYIISLSLFCIFIAALCFLIQVTTFKRNTYKIRWRKNTNFPFYNNLKKGEIEGISLNKNEAGIIGAAVGAFDEVK